MIAAGDPQPNIYWLKNDIPVNESVYQILDQVIGKTAENETIVNSTLVINPIRRSDQAVYTARVAYGLNSFPKDTTTDLTVLCEYMPITF